MKLLIAALSLFVVILVLSGEGRAGEKPGGRPAVGFDAPPDESGYEAWLRYPRQSQVDPAFLTGLGALRRGAGGPVLEAAAEEWSRGLRGLFGLEVVAAGPADRGVVEFVVNPDLGREAWRITSGEDLRIEGGSEAGVLYGVFAALRGLHQGKKPSALTGESVPAIPLRMLNHWDNLVADPIHGSIERVKGGDTLFDWTDLSYPNPRYEDYARLLASVGINGISLNNVNADPQILAPATIEGMAALASVFRRWGVRIYVSVNFASPVWLGGLPTADPLDPAVRAWWASKADEMYRAIPDFGGWLVKADSEGKPGPGTYGRSHVEGSDCLAEALAPHGGVLFWRAFVYGRDLSQRMPHARAAADRANAASYEFMHLDGQFAENVILQVKCSAIDFQIWEPAHALLGKLPRTRLSLEFSLTKEYSGQDVHMNWEGPYFHHILNFDATGEGVEGRVAAQLARPDLPGAVVAVANVNNSRNGFGHLLHGASLFTYGRLAWEPTADPQDLLREWAELTFNAEVAGEVVEIMKDSYDTVAAYTMPMGLTYISEFLHHYEPDPWQNHRGAGITSEGIGTDRTVKTGSGYIGLYPAEYGARLEDPATCPGNVLLYFHHLRWTHRLASGETVIQALYDSYADGVERVGEYRRQWRALHGRIDLERWAHVAEKLALQERHAERWRDLVCRYLAEVSGVPDARGRFSARMASPHNRVRSGFWKAVEDYRARVERERASIGAAEGTKPR